MKEVSTYMGQCEYCIDLFEKIMKNNESNCLDDGSIAFK